MGKFLESNTEPGMILRKTLGKWINPTHKTWDWRWDSGSDTLFHLPGQVADVYLPAAGRRRTRSEAKYIRVRTTGREDFIGNTASFMMVGDSGAILVSTRPEMKEGIDRQEGFWDYV